MGNAFFLAICHIRIQNSCYVVCACTANNSTIYYCLLFCSNSIWLAYSFLSFVEAATLRWSPSHRAPLLKFTLQLLPSLKGWYGFRSHVCGLFIFNCVIIRRTSFRGLLFCRVACILSTWTPARSSTQTPKIHRYVWLDLLIFIYCVFGHGLLLTSCVFFFFFSFATLVLDGRSDAYGTCSLPNDSGFCRVKLWVSTCPESPQVRCHLLVSDLRAQQKRSHATFDSTARTTSSPEPTRGMYAYIDGRCTRLRVYLILLSVLAIVRGLLN